MYLQGLGCEGCQVCEAVCFIAVSWHPQGLECLQRARRYILEPATATPSCSPVVGGDGWWAAYCGGMVLATEEWMFLSIHASSAWATAGLVAVA
jgi:hypothetical protein